MRVRKSFLPGALLRSFSGSSTGQGVGIICQQTEEEFSGCESLLSLSQTFFNWHGMCIYRPGDTSKEKRCPHGREHMERAVQKNHGREGSPETDDAGGGAQQRIGPTRTGVTIETAAPRCAIVNATSNDWMTLVMRSAILWLKN